MNCTTKTQASQNPKRGGEGNTGSPHPKRRYRNWFFTINNYSEMDIHCTEKLENCEYAFQEECGESGVRHLQGVICWKSARTFSRMKQINPRAHWEICRNKKAAIKYVTKLDTRAGKVYTNMEIKIPRIIYDKYEECTPYDWQTDIMEIIKGKVDDRKVYWYWESRGGVGKSCFTRHLILKHNALAIGSKARDIRYAISEFVKKHDLKLVVIDIPRSSYNNVSYKAIEEIKNGFFFSGKYESNMCVFNIPHVIVFANFKPQVEQMSQDRWCIVEISNV